MRKLAVGAGVLSVILIVLDITLYDNILQVVPVIRGIEAEKSLFLVMRILIINILTLMAFLVLAKSIQRSHRNDKLETYGSWILVFIMFKMLVEFLGLFHEVFLNLQMYPLLVGVGLLLAYGLVRHRYLLGREFWKTVRFDVSENIALVVILIAYLAVNIPAISMIAS